MDKYVSVKKETVVKGKMVDYYPTQIGWCVVLELKVPVFILSKSNIEIEKIMQKTMVTKLELDTLLENSDKDFDVIISTDMLGKPIIINKINIPVDYKINTFKTKAKEVENSINTEGVIEAILKDIEEYDKYIKSNNRITSEDVYVLSLTSNVIVELQETDLSDIECCYKLEKDISKFIIQISKLEKIVKRLNNKNFLINMSLELLRLKLNLLEIIGNLAFAQ